MAKPVYALVGPDSFLQLEHLAAIKRELPADLQQIDIDGERTELASLLDELRSFAMFAGSKLVVVRNADALLTRFREQLEDYVAAPSSSAVLVLRLTSLPANQRIYKAIAKAGQIDPCTPPKDLAKWAMDRAKLPHKMTLKPDAARLLADFIGDDLGRLDNELGKLAINFTGKTVGPDDIADTVSFQREQQMWDMTNQLAAGNPAEAMRRWRHLVQLDPSAEFRAVTWLAMWLENVRKARAMRKAGQNPFEIATKLRIWPRELQGPFFKTIESFGDAGVAKAVDLLAEVDRQSKSGVGEAATNVERFILTLAAH